MKANSRDTHTRIPARRITAPVTQPSPSDPSKKILLLSYVDARSSQRHDPTTRDLFLYAAGSSTEGEVSDGLDRLSDHLFIIHQNEKGKAIGLDIIPARLYRSGVIPVSQIDVKTLKVQILLGGAVLRVIQRPFNTRPEVSQRVINELDKLITAGKEINASMRLGEVGTVTSVTDDTVEIRLRAGSRPVSSGAGEDEMEQLAGAAVEE